MIKTDWLRHCKEFNPSPVSLSTKDRDLLAATALKAKRLLKKNIKPGFGIFPSAHPDDNFYNQVWTRDFSHAAGNYFMKDNPEAVIDSLTTIFKHQRKDGALPFRVEREYLVLKLFPGLRFLAKPLFGLIEKRIKGRTERPVYEGQDFCRAADTVPAAIVAVGEFFISSPEGKRFANEHFEQLKLAVDFCRQKSDPADGLLVAKKPNPDWADSLRREGKLGLINILWARALKLMELMSTELGYPAEAQSYQKEFQNLKKSVLEKLYNPTEAYFRTVVGENRLDTAASIFGSLYLLDLKEAERVQKTLKERVGRKSGLKNFDPPYPAKQVFIANRLIGLAGYHNEFVWPWIKCQNIRIKIRIAFQNPEQCARDQYKKEAVEDLLDLAKLFKKAGGAYEIFRPDDRKPVKHRWYKPPKNFMANLAAFLGAYMRLKELGWIP